MMTRLVPCAGALALALAFAQVASTQQVIDRPEPAPLGKLVNVGGRKLHLYCTGEGHPTVVLESGAGSFSVDWALVQPEVAKMTRVCSYDRAGYGWSDPGPEWDTVEQVTHDLDAVLKNGGEHPPYVLVGQSIAGLFVLWYQHEHPDQVAGIVLVDHRAIGVPVNGKVVPIWTLSREQLQATLPPPSSLKKPPLPTEVHPPFDKLPANLRSTHVWLERHFFETVDFNKGPAMMESWRVAFATLRQTPPEPKKQEATATLPIIVLTADDANAEERQQQADLLRLSQNSRQIIAVHSGHFIQLDRPDLVIDSIKDVLAAQPVGRHLP